MKAERLLSIQLNRINSNDTLTRKHSRVASITIPRSLVENPINLAGLHAWTVPLNMESSPGRSLIRLGCLATDLNMIDTLFQCDRQLFCFQHRCHIQSNGIVFWRGRDSVV